MFEKVNPSHPDKVADRIAGAIVDIAYKKNESPKIAVEVLIGHGLCTIIAETSESIKQEEIRPIVDRIAGAGLEIKFICTLQDIHLAKNQHKAVRCGDNGIFKGSPLSLEQVELSKIAHQIYERYPYDGKYIKNGQKLIICQSNAKSRDIKNLKNEFSKAIINPLGEWTGGTSVDSGATNRKLGSDIGDGVTGGGLHGKDLSKADVSVNIYAHLLAQQENREVKFVCAIGDENVGGIPYSDIVKVAKEYIDHVGGFEKFAEWGLV